MISIYLSAHALAAARAIDPAVRPAAIHAAIEIAIADELMEVANCSAVEIKARAAAVRHEDPGLGV